MKETNKTDQSNVPVTDAINEIANGINAGDMVIFCGAGISRDSGFPVVDEFIPYVLLTLCASSEEITTKEAELKDIKNDTQRQERLKQIIAERMEVLPEVIDKIISSLPFEAFVENLRNNSTIDKIFEIYDANAYEPHVKPNTNHVFLARLVATGKVRTIVTTNFDQLIEKALEQQGKQAGHDYDVLYREEDFDRIDWAQDCCRLIKIHGSIDDKQHMDITLSQVASQKLSAARAGIIRHVFSESSHKQVLILGYSCSDVFDLSPQIQALAENLKQVCLVKHSDVPKTEDIREQDEKNPFKTFVNSTRLFFNTSHLVESLWKATLKEPYPEAGADTRVFKISPDWKAKVQSWYADSVQTNSKVIKDNIPGLLFDAICEWQAVIGRYEHVLSYAREHADDKLEGLALNNMGSAYNSLSEYGKAIDFLEQALIIARRIPDVQGEGKALGNIGNVYSNLGEYGKAIGFFEKQLEIARHIKDVQGEGSALNNMGIAYSDLGEYGKAIEIYEQTLKIDLSVGYVHGKGATLCNMGSAYVELGKYDKAIELFEQALEIALRIGDAQGEGTAQNDIGSAYKNLHQYDKAIDRIEKALKIARRVEDMQGEGNALNNIGNVYRELVGYHKAIGFFEQGLEIARLIKDVKGESDALNGMGSAYLQLGEYHKAIGFFEQSLKIERRIKNVKGERNTLDNMGIAYRELGENEKAIGLFEQALEIARRIKDIKGEGGSLCNMSSAYMQLGECGKAIEFLEQALKIARLIPDMQMEGAALGNLGIAYMELGEYRKAIEFFEQALEIDRRIPNKRDEGSVLGSMGNTYALIGDKGKAAQAFAQSKAIFTNLGLQHMVSTIDSIMKQVGL